FKPLQLISDLLADYEPIAQQKGLTLSSHIHHIDYSLEGDAEKIQQILSILLSNAIKFTPTGQVSITSQLTHFDHSNRWQIRIKDSGIGIDSRDRKSTRLNSSHVKISYAVFCLKKKKKKSQLTRAYRRHR